MHGHYISKNRATPLGKCTENASNTVLFPLRRGMDWYIAFVTYLVLWTPPTTEIHGRARTVSHKSRAGPWLCPTWSSVSLLS